MRIGMIGLGRMGANMVRRLLKGGHECVVYDRSADAVKASVAEGARGAASLKSACPCRVGLDLILKDVTPVGLSMACTAPTKLTPVTSQKPLPLARVPAAT